MPAPTSYVPVKGVCNSEISLEGVLGAVNNTSVCKYWKILFYPSNTDAGTFYRSSTDIDTDAQHPKCNTDILVFPVFYSISILCFKPLIDSCHLRLLAL